MLIANGGHVAEFHNYAKKVRRNVRTARVVTEIFLKYFLPAIRCNMVRFDDHPRRRELRANVYIISPIRATYASNIERVRQVPLVVILLNAAGYQLASTPTNGPFCVRRSPIWSLLPVIFSRVPT